MNKEFKKEKPRILLIWDVSRPDLFEPFYNLKDEIEFIVLWKGEKDNLLPVHPFEEIYFKDYKNPYRLLSDIKPKALLFFGIHSNPQIALNLSAKNIGLKTYTLHHGIHPSNRLSINIEKNAMGMVNRKEKLINSFETLKFYLLAIRLKNIGQIHKYLRFPIVRRKLNTFLALQHSNFEGRMPSKFIELSPHNAISSKQVNQSIPEDRYVYIGHPFFDSIFKKFKELKQSSEKADEKYFLLIDFANVESNVAFRKIGMAAKIDFYKRLSALARQNGCRLKIKVHPAGYQELHTYQDENIELIYDTDIASLIYFAEECFSFYSTLVIPIIFQKGYCYLFDTGINISTQNELVALGVAKKLSIENFKSDDLFIKEAKEIFFDEFIKRYIFHADGQSSRRLRDVLFNHTS